METLADPVLHRSVERIVAALGAVFFGYIGYKLFIFGVTVGRSRVGTDVSSIYRIIFSGIGPGLCLMTFGAIVLVIALLTGAAEEYRHSPQVQRDASPGQVAQPPEASAVSSVMDSMQTGPPTTENLEERRTESDLPLLERR